MSITAAMVKELREKSGAGMMDCKTALTENGGDMEAAVDWLRTKGLAKAAKKAGRVAAEGLVGVAAEGTKAAVIELNSETDFVARNEGFQELVGKVATVAVGTDGSVDAVAAANLDGKSVADSITDAIATIGENMTLRRTAILSVGDGVVSTYVHGAVADGLGKIGVLVALESPATKKSLTRLAVTSPCTLQLPARLL
jgi:elongation factor Ts